MGASTDALRLSAAPFPIPAHQTGRAQTRAIYASGDAGRNPSELSRAGDHHRPHHPFEGLSLEVLRQVRMPAGLQFILMVICAVEAHPTSPFHSRYRKEARFCAFDPVRSASPTPIWI
jgi:hypothetical protein